MAVLHRVKMKAVHGAVGVLRGLREVAVRKHMRRGCVPQQVDLAALWIIVPSLRYKLPSLRPLRRRLQRRLKYTR
jgi:hypothetical protein